MATTESVGMSRGDRYRKKPVVIEALVLPGLDDREVMPNSTAFQLGRLAEFLRTADWQFTEDGGLDITTLEGVMHARPGDYVVRGIKGEFYPCKPDIFKETYESLTESNDD